MGTWALKGHICQSRDPQQIEITENGYLIVENGLSKGVFPTLPEQYRGLPVADFGDRLIIPGMTDLHVHAPQFSFRGLGMDMELLDWLNTYAFPEEAKYRDLEYANRAYGMFAQRLKRSVTTRAVIFGTIHLPATELLMRIMDRTGLKTYVGKVNMDRNSPDYLREFDAEKSLRDTEEWIIRNQCRFDNTKPILTPRFVPSCSDALMEGLGKLREKYALPVQSHLSENLGEVRWVKELCPYAAFYGDAYDRWGLFGGAGACVMAHCVHSTDEELERMLANGVYVAHSPESNMNLASGVAPVRKYLDLGLHVGLATDLAAGSHESLLRAMMHAIQASKLRWRLCDDTLKPLTVDEVFYLATLGGGSFFGKVGCFRPGYELDAVILDDQDLPHPQRLDVRARLERCVYLADDRNVYAKFVAGERIL